MSISEEIKAIINTIEQNKVRYELDKQTARISALSSKNVKKYAFSTVKYVLPEERLARKSCCNEKT